MSKLKETEIGMIPEDWDIVIIGDAVKINEETINKKYSEAEIEYIDISSVDSGHLLGTQKFKLEEAPSRAKRIIKDGDILISTVRPNLKHFFFIKKSKENLIGSTGFAVISSKKINPEFLYYYLTTQNYTDFLTSIADSHTSTYPSFNPDIIETSPCPFPKESEQSAIAKILSDLDSKIELNQQMNRTLEAIGQAIFKRWFVDERKDDWKKGKLRDIGKIQPGFAFKSKDFLNSGIGLVKIKNIQNSVIEFNFESHISKELFFKTDKKFYLKSGDVLIAMTGAKIGKIGIIPKTEKEFLLNQRVGKVSSENKYLMYLILNTPEIQGLILGGSSASSAQGNISNSDIENFDCLIPPKEITKKINKIINPIFSKIVDNLGKIQTLSDIRDSLLPRLMSGKIRVPVEVIA